MDNVGCTGGESRLLDCSNAGVGVYSSNCGHDDDAGVRCNGMHMGNYTTIFILVCTVSHSVCLFSLFCLQQEPMNVVMVPFVSDKV